MKRSALHILLAVAVLVCTLLPSACDMVHEDLPPCEHRLHFVYEHNMKFADAWPHEAEQITLFIFDMDGNYLDEKNFSAEEAKAGHVLLNLQPGSYRMLAWSSLNSGDYRCLAPANRAGSHIEDYGVRMNAERQAIDRDLTPLFHGMQTVTIPEGSNSNIRFPLVKDTNTFRLIVQAHTEGTTGSVSAEDFEFSITDDNVLLAHDNAVTAEGTPLTYVPYYLGDGLVHDSEGNVVQTTACAELNTNRLTCGTHPRLLIRHKVSGKVWLDVDLIEYLMLMPTEGSLDQMLDREHPQQEYLDREDKYVIVFFFTTQGQDPADPGNKVVNLWININGWTVRVNNIDAEI